MNQKKDWRGNYDAKFEDLKGKTIIELVGDVGDDTLVFVTSDNEKYQMHYYEDCCASCRVEDICGDVKDIFDVPILLAEEVSSRENPPGVTKEYQESFTWTFYKLSTIKGSVTFRWYGESNGYYSESVTFERVGTEP